MYKKYFVEKIFFLRVMEMAAALHKTPKLKETSEVSKDCLGDGYEFLAYQDHIGYWLWHSQGFTWEIIAYRNISKRKHTQTPTKTVFLLPHKMQGWNKKLEGCVQRPYSLSSRDRDIPRQKSTSGKTTFNTAHETSRNPIKSLRTMWGAHTKICGKKIICKNSIIIDVWLIPQIHMKAKSHTFTLYRFHSITNTSICAAAEKFLRPSVQELT